MATKKLSEIAAKYNFDYDDFEKFVEDNYHSSTKRRLLGNKIITEIFDSKVDECVNAYKSSPETMEKNEKARLDFLLNKILAFDTNALYLSDIIRGEIDSNDPRIR